MIGIILGTVGNDIFPNENFYYLSGLQAGLYTVTVTDENGCMLGISHYRSHKSSAI